VEICKAKTKEICNDILKQQGQMNMKGSKLKLRESLSSFAIHHASMDDRNNYKGRMNILKGK